MFFFFKQKTAYEILDSDWSSDVCSSDLAASVHQHLGEALLADDGIDDERVASRSRDVGGLVPLIEGDRRFRPTKEIPSRLHMPLGSIPCASAWSRWCRITRRS